MGFIIHNAWEQCKLGDFGNCKSGVGFPEKEQGGENGFPFFKVSDMNIEGNERILKKANNYVTSDQVKHYSWNIAKSPAIFFAKVGAAVLLDRKRLTLSNFLLDNNTMYYPINKSYWDINFCFSAFERTHLPSLIQVGALPSYNGNQVDDLVIFIPKKAEQEKVGKLLLDIDNLITLHQRNYFYFDKVIICLFLSFTNAWEQRKLGNIGNTFTGLSGKTKEDFGHGEAQFITYMNIFSNPIANRDIVEKVEIDNKQNKVNYGDIFFTTSSETPEEVGMSSIWLENTENTYLNSFCFGYRLSNDIKINPYYLAYLLRAPKFRSNMILLAQGISRYNISKNKVMDISIDIPKTNEEQIKIGTALNTIDNLITLHHHKSIYVKLAKDLIIKSMSLFSSSFIMCK